MSLSWVALAGGEFSMGSAAFYPEESPVHRARVDAFEMSPHAVTNGEFAQFVEDTGYITVAEEPLDPADFPHGHLAVLDPGSLVFTATPGPVDLRDWRQWWRWVPGANWRHPRGPESNLDGLDRHPVVQVAYRDAVAYATWAGGRLPTEAEWEYAARGGLEGATYSWGEEPNDGTRANTWQGHFPYHHAAATDDTYTAPVGSYPPNGFGLYEMTGNTWEWTSSPWASQHSDAHCGTGAHRGHGALSTTTSRVLKGGSHLCSPDYCLRYRPAARSEQTEDSATSHIGFRVAR